MSTRLLQRARRNLEVGSQVTFPVRIGNLICTLLRWELASAGVLLLGLALASGAARSQHTTIAGSDLCYAFLRDNDIWTVCQGRREQIRVTSKVSEFVVSADGSHLAYYTNRTSPRGRALPHQDLILVSLEPGFRTMEKGAGVKPENLFGTCGTILKYSNQSDTTQDLLAGEPSDLPPRGFLQCSSNRRVVARWTSSQTTSGGQLVLTLNGAEKLRLPRVGVDFRISPTGKYLAYQQQLDPNGFPDHRLVFQFCLGEPRGVASCYSELGDIRVTNSLSDLGEVLYLAEIDKSCGEAGVCMGIAYWRPGMEKGEIIERDDSSDPQWITPEVAARLHEWGSTLRHASTVIRH
jgi:hypothetical protein